MHNIKIDYPVTKKIAMNLKESINQNLMQGNDVKIDIENGLEFDIAGFSVLVASYYKSLELGRKLIINVSKDSSLYEMFTLTRLDFVLC